jgi:hypothetical protein
MWESRPLMITILQPPAALEAKTDQRQSLCCFAVNKVLFSIQSQRPKLRSVDMPGIFYPQNYWAP